MSYRNHEHYYDPTAGEAISRIMGNTEKRDPLGEIFQTDESYTVIRDQIILQAVKDHEEACRKLKRNPRNKEALAMKADVERFIRSREFRALMTIDPERFLRMLRMKEAEE